LGYVTGYFLQGDLHGHNQDLERLPHMAERRGLRQSHVIVEEAIATDWCAPMNPGFTAEATPAFRSFVASRPRIAGIPCRCKSRGQRGKKGRWLAFLLPLFGVVTPLEYDPFRNKDTEPALGICGFQADESHGLRQRRMNSYEFPTLTAQLGSLSVGAVQCAYPFLPTELRPSPKF
jgi:hypothetical protein